MGFCLFCLVSLEVEGGMVQYCAHTSFNRFLRPIAYTHTSDKKPNENNKLVASFNDILFFFSFCHDFDVQLFELFVGFPKGKLHITYAQK